MRLSGSQGGQHEVPDPQQRQARDSGYRGLGSKDKKENLDDIMIALEVAQDRMLSQDGRDYMGQLALACF